MPRQPRRRPAMTPGWRAERARPVAGPRIRTPKGGGTSRQQAASASRVSGNRRSALLPPGTGRHHVEIGLPARGRNATSISPHKACNLGPDLRCCLRAYPGQPLQAVQKGQQVLEVADANPAERHPGMPRQLQTIDGTIGNLILRPRHGYSLCRIQRSGRPRPLRNSTSPPPLSTEL